MVLYGVLLSLWQGLRPGPPIVVNVETKCVIIRIDRIVRSHVRHPRVMVDLCDIADTTPLSTVQSRSQTQEDRLGE